MGDRVNFLHNTSSPAFSGFPFEVRNAKRGDVGLGTAHPWGFTVEEMAAFYWRAQWDSALVKLSASASCSIDGTAGIFVPASARDDATVLVLNGDETNNSYFANRELDLCGDAISWPNVGYTFTKTDANCYTVMSCSLGNTNYFLGDTKQRYIKDVWCNYFEGMYYPLLSFDVIIEAHAWTNLSMQSFRTVNKTGRFSRQVKIFGRNHEILGDSISVNNSTSGDGEQMVTFKTSTTLSQNIEICPSGYWPYSNSKGDAIWDSATGAQLNDPLS